MRAMENELITLADISSVVHLINTTGRDSSVIELWAAVKLKHRYDPLAVSTTTAKHFIGFWCRAGGQFLGRQTAWRAGVVGNVTAVFRVSG